MMTGDGNLIEVQATLRYAIDQPRAYFFEINDAPALLRDATEAVLRELTASRTFAELLTTGRQSFAEVALERLRERCAALGPHGLGIRLDGLALHDLHPPQEVVDSYHEVTKAMEARDRRVNLARAAALGRARRQEAASLRVVREAEAQAADTTRRAAAEQDAFLDRLAARRQLSLGAEVDLLLDAVGDLTAGVPPASAAADYQRRRAARQSQQQTVNDFRLFWDALARALAGREKVIVDADRVPGRRHLWLLPPELLRSAAGAPLMERGSRPSRGTTVDEP
jgi:regulator of protease activity HflC (stomatin/prohibitin superfamily)